MSTRHTPCPTRWFVLVGQKLCRVLGLRRAADLLYVRLLEGFMTRKGAGLLYDTARNLSGPGDLAEIGSWKGKSTVALGLAVLVVLLVWVRRRGLTRV